MGCSSFFKFLILLVLIASTISMLSAARVYAGSRLRMLANKKGSPSPPPPPKIAEPPHHILPPKRPIPPPHHE
ncbi:hypothetical protein O6P43_008533 [Quillaja saponaria]|uniref:Transmembrane protein n=1 Tax=Quillaja saponaria TaxID=32244 RepID=A0AAD7M823_QUISA|nr:hypothetical protein O6P43_008533 [Quillaja saponaria]